MGILTILMAATLGVAAQGHVLVCDTQVLEQGSCDFCGPTQTGKITQRFVFEEDTALTGDSQTLEQTWSLDEVTMNSGVNASAIFGSLSGLTRVQIVPGSNPMAPDALFQTSLILGDQDGELSSATNPVPTKNPSLVFGFRAPLKWISLKTRCRYWGSGD